MQKNEFFEHCIWWSITIIFTSVVYRDKFGFTSLVKKSTNRSKNGNTSWLISSVCHKGIMVGRNIIIILLVFGDGVRSENRVEYLPT